MEHTTSQQGSETQQTSGLLAGLQFLDGILKWLAGLFRLTDKEREDAGIHFGHQGYS